MNEGLSSVLSKALKKAKKKIKANASALSKSVTTNINTVTDAEKTNANTLKADVQEIGRKIDDSTVQATRTNLGTVADNVERELRDAGQKIEKAARDTGDSFERLGERLEGGASKVWTEARDTIGTAAEKIGEGAGNALNSQPAGMSTGLKITLAAVSGVVVLGTLAALLGKKKD